MSKLDTVNKYKEEFLEGKSAEKVARFLEKDVDKQYASIMQWRLKQRRAQNTPKSTKDIVEGLRKMNAMIQNAPELTNQDVQAIADELTTLNDTLNNYAVRQRERMIQELEAQRRQLDARLAALRPEE